MKGIVIRSSKLYCAVAAGFKSLSDEAVGLAVKTIPNTIVAAANEYARINGTEDEFRIRPEFSFVGTRIELYLERSNDDLVKSVDPGKLAAYLEKRFRAQGLNFEVAGDVLTENNLRSIKEESVARSGNLESDEVIAGESVDSDQSPETLIRERIEECNSCNASNNRTDDAEQPVSEEEPAD